MEGLPDHVRRSLCDVLCQFFRGIPSSIEKLLFLSYNFNALKMPKVQFDVNIAIDIANNVRPV